jgi:hypothetical protein
MKHFNLFAITYILSATLFWYFHDLQTSKLSIKIEEITAERDELKNKIYKIEEGLKTLGKKTNNTQNNPTTTKKEKTKKVEKDINKPNTKSFQNYENEDIVSQFPNRKGQDLVNSLKIKTGL